jgi:hypothetical protein
MQETYRVGEGPLGLLFLGRGKLPSIFPLAYHAIAELLSPAVGNTLGVILNALFSDLYIRYKKAKGETKPELRLPLMVFGAVTLPLGLLVYGWTMNKDIPWILPIIGTGISGFSTLLTILPTSNYLVDVFDPLGTSASAVAACAIMQGLIGAILPLAGP